MSSTPEMSKQTDQLAADNLKATNIKKASFEEMLKKDFGIQLKMPGSHAQKAVSAFQTLMAVKELRKMFVSELARLVMLLKEQIMSKRMEDQTNGVRKSHGGEGVTSEQLAAKQRKINELQAKMDQLAKQEAEYEKKLKDLTEKYDSHYQSLAEKHETEKADFKLIADQFFKAFSKDGYEAVKLLRRELYVKYGDNPEFVQAFKDFSKEFKDGEISEERFFELVEKHLGKLIERHDKQFCSLREKHGQECEGIMKDLTNLREQIQAVQKEVKNPSNSATSSQSLVEPEQAQQTSRITSAFRNPFETPTLTKAK